MADNIRSETRTVILVIIALLPAVSSGYATGLAHDFYISWFERRPMPTPLAGCAGAVINDTLYVVGGRDSSGRGYNYCYAYVPDLNRWLVRAPMPTARADLRCAAVGGRLYAIGGMDFSGRVLSNNEVYSPAANSWTTHTHIPTGRIGAATFVLGNRIHVAGGTNLGQATRLHEAYDVDTDQWSLRASLLHHRFGVGAAACNGHGYAIGGDDYVQCLSSVEVYDTLADSWTYETSMEYARQSMATGLIQNRIYAVGGWNGRSLSYNEEGTVPVSVEEEKEGLIRPILMIRPNPSRGRVRANLSAVRGHAENGVVRILDVCGREVRRVELPARVRHEIRPDLPPGVFYFYLESSGSGVRTKVVVVD